MNRNDRNLKTIKWDAWKISILVYQFLCRQFDRIDIQSFFWNLAEKVPSWISWYLVCKNFGKETLRKNSEILILILWVTRGGGGRSILVIFIKKTLASCRTQISPMHIWFGIQSVTWSRRIRWIHRSRNLWGRKDSNRARRPHSWPT